MASDSTIGIFFNRYNQLPRKLRIIDLFLLWSFFTGVIQFVYVCLVGTFPFNSFLSGFISTVGTFVLFGMYFKSFRIKKARNLHVFHQHPSDYNSTHKMNSKFHRREHLQISFFVTSYFI